MKSIWLITVVLVCLFGVASEAQTLLDQKRDEFDKVQQYLDSLDVKILTARTKREISRVIELKELKDMALVRAKDLKMEIVKLEKGEAVEGSKAGLAPTALGQPSHQKYWQLGLGIGGGAALGEVNYPFRLDDFALLANVGLGVGNGYGIIKMGVIGQQDIGQNLIGLELGLAIYSRPVTDIPGLTGNIDASSRLNFAVFGSRELDENRQVHLGYSTALGLLARLIYTFN